MAAITRRHVLVKAAATGVAAAFATSAQTREPHEHVVSIKSFAFDPAELEVRIGDQITWTNHDIAPHTATGLDHAWDTQELGMDQSATLVVTAQMVGAYYCVFHPHMKASITLLGA